MERRLMWGNIMVLPYDGYLATLLRVQFLALCRCFWRHIQTLSVVGLASMVLRRSMA